MLKKLLFIVGILTLSFFTSVTSLYSQPNYRNEFIAADSAYKAKNYPLFYEKIKRANQIHPYHQGILYYVGIASALMNKPDEAMVNLRKAILINADYPLDIADLQSLKKNSQWNHLLSLQARQKQVVSNSTLAFTIHDRQLHSEGIAYDRKSKILYVGSIHKRKVIKVSDDGQAQDFCRSGIEGMGAVFGLQIDSVKKLLWVCSSPIKEMEKFDTTARPLLLKFDLTYGILLKKYSVAEKYKNAIFGDLTLDSHQTPYVSDGENNIIWKLNEKTDQLEEFYTSKEFWNIQGISFTSDDRTLFVADYVKGVFKLELSNQNLRQLKTNLDLSQKGIDGLYFYKKSLIAIQNGVSPLRVVRYYLNNSLDAIVNIEILDNNRPEFGEPTLGTLVGSSFYYIANSQWGGYDEAGVIKPFDMLQDIYILKKDLK